MPSSKPNRLSLEKSPYLLQHAHNPVDWYPWGKEAFEKAARENKPVFLSIGYSTCHWCHVMEHESFEDAKTAELLNESFVSIKVDREERPDVDGVYMSFVMAATGSGGWPMSVFLTPEQKPFFGGTYFPPSDRYGMPGFRTVLSSIADAWKTRRGEIEQSSESSAAFLAGPRERAAAAELGVRTLAEAAGDFAANFDETRGGFGGAPKFPRSHALSFLLGEAHYARDARAREIAEKTLVEMARGGLFDQLGGGFHRYSTDAQWRVPHFEKMLYDQALLARTYVDAYRLTKDAEYARVARETLEYVLRDLTAPEGGFYSAEDADSAGPDDPSRKREGAFFVWTRAEIDAALGPERGSAFAFHYGVEERGNAISDPHNEFTNRNVLYLAHPTAETAKKFGKSESETSSLLAECRKVLFAERETRPRPHRDDKVLADWNGLMIGAFAEAARAFDEPRYLDAARRAAMFVETKLVDGGRLYHRWRDGERAVPAFLADLAFLASGYLSLYEAGFEEKWLGRALELAADMTARFGDEANGGFFVSAHDAEPLLARPKETYDGAVPSGNSTAAHVFHRLARMTGRAEFRRTADRTLESFSAALAASPSQYPQALTALRLAVGPAREVVIAAAAGDAGARALARETGFSFSPNQVILFHRAGEAGALAKWAPFAAGLKPVEGRAAAYVCVDRACRLPALDPAGLKKILEEPTHP